MLILLFVRYSCNSPGGDSCQHASRKRRRGMIEKKRRDRINASLGELRRLVPAAARDPHSGKLEKAEILQLTVEHLRSLRNKGKPLDDHHHPACCTPVGPFPCFDESDSRRGSLAPKRISRARLANGQCRAKRNYRKPGSRTESRGPNVNVVPPTAWVQFRRAKWHGKGLNTP